MRCICNTVITKLNSSNDSVKLTLPCDHPWPVTVDLEARTLSLPGGKTTSFPLDGFARHCLLNGIDQLDFLLHQEDAIARFESRST